MTPNLHLWLIPVLRWWVPLSMEFFRQESSRQTVAAVACCSAAQHCPGFCQCLPLLFPGEATQRNPGYLDSRRQLSGDFAFYLDQLSLVMLLVVTGVGFLFTFIPSVTCGRRAVSIASSPT